MKNVTLNKKNTILPAIAGILASFMISGICMAADTVPVVIQQPGTQPQEISNLESPDKCDNCHGGYNKAVEPAHNWRGSMMAHAGRDPVFWATLAIAEQDFDGSGDLCIRCHSTGGWLAGRSTPTDGSGLAAGDSDGVECDYCHKLTNPDNSDPLLQGIMLAPFIANILKEDGSVEGYYGSGMSSMWGGSDKLGPYHDAEARHQFYQSKFHRSPDFCGTCHDVSNPAVGNLAHNFGAQITGDAVTADGSLGGTVESKAAFNNTPYKYGVVERTYSEYKSGQISQTLVRNYSQLPADLKGGALEAIYQAALAAGTGGNYADGTDRYFSCQSCHMRPVTGYGANKRGIPLRTDLPLHDMTGGNYWMPDAIDYLNAAGKLRLGGGMSQNQIDAMRDGIVRAKEQLNLAATLSVNKNTLKIVNHTGHKLISGYPEGRRMWVNIKWYDGNNTLLREDGAYGPIGVTVLNPADGLPVEVESILNLEDPNTKIYEAHYGLTKEWAQQLVDMNYSRNLALEYDRTDGSVTATLGALANGDYGAAHESFHFVLNNTVVEDNRIPPYGMRYDEARKRNVLPAPVNQYGGGSAGSTYRYWDELTLNPPAAAVYAGIDLLYQPTSWEYIQFLDRANSGKFAFLADEGRNMLEAWLNTGMAAPYVMASATWGTPSGEGCDAGIPTLLTAAPSNAEVALTWQGETGSQASGYKVYYDQSGKAQLVADLDCQAGSCTEYTDSGLTNNQEYCYKVTAYTASCESGFSNILCATTTNQGQAVTGVVDPMTTGKVVKEGKGKNANETFVATSSFVAGDDVIIRGLVKDKDGTPTPNAEVTILIRTQDLVPVSTLTSSPSDARGAFEVIWNTQAHNRKGQGGTDPGVYTGVVSGVTASGYSWDAVPTAVSVSIE